MDRELTHLSLFSGIGGLDLAAEWAGFRTVGQCEWADYPRAVLEKHWAGLPRWRDIRRNTKWLTINGETKTVVEWCGQFGLSQYTVYDWIRNKGNEYAVKRITEAWNRRVEDA